MCVSLPTLDLPEIQDDSRLRLIELQSIVFITDRLPLLCFYGNPYSRLPTHAQNRIRGFPQTRRSGSTLSRFGGFVQQEGIAMNPLITEDERRQLLAYGQARAAGQTIDPLPVVRLFTPDAHATWLLAALDPADGDTAHGLIDLGISMPELGTVKLSDLAAIVGPRQQPVMRDRYFQAVRPLSEYLRLAQENGSVVD